jgi:hypothetical protein
MYLPNSLVYIDGVFGRGAEEASNRIADGDGRDAHTHALVQHLNVIIEGVKCGSLHAQLFVSPTRLLANSW